MNHTMAANQRRRLQREAKQARKRTRNATGNPESQSVPLDPDYWDELGWMGARADSGVRMNHQNAIGQPAIWRAISLIAQGVAKLPSDVKKLSENGDESATDKTHPAQYLLSRKANRFMTSYTWKKTMIYHAVFRGNGYSAIVRKGGSPDSFILLDPVKTEQFWIGEELWYKTEAGGEKRRIPAADVFHLRGLSFNGLAGHDVLKLMANALGMGPAARKWLSKLMSRGSTAGGLLQLPRELSPEARKKRQEEFDKYQSGLDNAFKTLALEDGAKWIRTMVTPQEAAILEVLGHDLNLVSNIFGVPGHKLGDNAKASHNSLEQENKSFLDDALDPWCCEFESEGNDKLLTEEQNRSGSHEVVIDRTQFEMGDMESQSTSFTGLVNGGLCLPDEGRKRLGLPPLPNGEGKKLRVPTNVSIDGRLAARPGDPVATETGSNPTATETGSKTNSQAARNAKMMAAVRDALGDRLRRLEKIAGDQLPKALAKGEAAVVDFWRVHRERIADSIKPLLPVLALAEGLDVWPETAEEIANRVDTENIPLSLVILERGEG